METDDTKTSSSAPFGDHVDGEVSADDESSALRSIVGGPTQNFFDNTWQKSCQIYRCNQELSTMSNDAPLGSHEWNDDKVKENPFQELVANGWFALVQMLQQARSRYRDEQDDPSTMLPLVFSEQEPVPIDKVQSTYGSNLFLAYLDGCSIVINHADLTCPYLAALCLDLQKSLPHAYVNAYLTPPSSRAVRPHADDRDVLVVQLVGQKHWKVYQNVPIPYPYPHQQVGKDGFAVPPSVLEGPCIVDTVLYPGDVLYMPRGFVHEARTAESHLSYHATIALATHDWTLSGLLTSAMRHSLENIVEYRMAVPLSFGMRNFDSISATEKESLQKQVHDALDLVKERVTVEAIHAHLQDKYQGHNQRALTKRMKRIHEARFPSFSDIVQVVGRNAAKNISLNTIVRAATAEEKASIQSKTQQQVGLHVRPETADAVMTFVEKFKSGQVPQCRVAELPTLLDDDIPHDLICNLTLLSFAKCCVELGALAVVVRLDDYL